MINGRILVVDDEVDIRESLETLLDIEGYTVEMAVDAGDAWRKLEKDDYDLILLDLMMPDRSGMELLAGYSGPRHRDSGHHAHCVWLGRSRGESAEERGERLLPEALGQRQADRRDQQS